MDGQSTFRLRTISVRAALLLTLISGVFGPLFRETLWNAIRDAGTHEVARSAAPDLLSDAVVIEHRTIRGIEPSVEVRIVKHEMPAAEGQKVLLARGVVNLKVLWREPRLLELSYDHARIDYYKSAWIPRPNDASKAIEVRLGPASPDFSYLRVSSLGFAKSPDDSPGGRFSR